MDIKKIRSGFPILQTSTYLNSCSLGALSSQAEARMLQFWTEWQAYGASAWYEVWLGRLDELRNRVGAMLNARPGEIALSASVSAALASIASCLDYGSGRGGDGATGGRNRVVVSELDFPTLAYQWMARPGVEVVRVPSDDGATIDIQRWADAVDERTAVVATSHVFFTTGAIQDLAAIGAIAREADALFVVDAYQSAGQVPVDVATAGADVLITGPLKWLMGGPGLAYLWVRESLHTTLEPTTTGWFATENPFDFDIGTLRFRDDARRFEMGTPALHTVHTALGGQDVVDQVGVPAIRERNRMLTERLIEKLDQAGFEMRMAGEPDQRSAIVMIAADDPRAAVRHLANADIIVDARPGYVRASPHFYNTEEEVDHLVDELTKWRNA